jgi:hypothetical protein
MSGEGETFATAVGCIDGRAVRSLDRYAEDKYGVYVDTVSKAGMDKYFCDAEHPCWEELMADVKVSVEKHNSKIIFVHGHDACAGNPVSREEHFSCIAKGVDLVRDWFIGSSIEVIGVWSAKMAGEWTTSTIKEETLQDAA